MSKFGFVEEIVAVVTGGSGFIGGESVIALSEDPMVKEIRILDVNFPDYDLTPKMKFHRVDVTDALSLIKHTKGVDLWLDNVGLLGTDNSVELGSYPKVASDVNVTGFLNQVEVAKLNGVRWFYHQTKPMFSHNYENWYTVTKKQAELTAFWARSTKNIPITVATYFNASGCRQHLGPVRKMFPLFTVLAIMDLDLAVYGSGKQLMDIIHVRDLVEASILLTLNDDYTKPHKVFDIGTGQSISVVDFSKRLIELTGSSSKIAFQPMRAGEAEDTEIRAATEDINDLSSRLGWSPKFTLDDIINEYVDYWLNTTDFTGIRNSLIYFQQTGRYFTRKGEVIDISDISVKGIAEAFHKKSKKAKS